MAYKFESFGIGEDQVVRIEKVGALLVQRLS